MKCRALRLPAALAGLLLALSLCACGAGEEQGFAGEVLQISDAEVLVSVLPNDPLRAQATQVAFPLDAIGGRENLEATVGEYRHGGLPRPGHAGGTGDGGRP